MISYVLSASVTQGVGDLQRRLFCHKIHFFDKVLVIQFKFVELTSLFVLSGIDTYQNTLLGDVFLGRRLLIIF